MVELSPGERLRTRIGAATLAAMERRPGLWPVFNLEVGDVHQYYVSSAEVLVHNIAPECPISADTAAESGLNEATSADLGFGNNHHIVTRYPGAGDAASRARGILANASIDLESDANEVSVAGHYGPHPAGYHEAVYQELRSSVQGLKVGSDSYREAVRSALLDLKNRLLDPTDPLAKLITK